MSWRRNLTLGLMSGALAVGGLAAAHGLAEARGSSTVVLRFFTGYFDGAGRYVPTGGRGSTNVDRNAIIMFVFSGAIDMGRNRQATLPLTLDEQAALLAAQTSDPDFDPSENGIELGQTPRRLSDDKSAYYVATGSISPASVKVVAPQIGGSTAQAPGQFFKVLAGRNRKALNNRLIFNPRYVVSTFNLPHQIDYNPSGFSAVTQYFVSMDGGANPASSFDLVRTLNGRPLGEPFSTQFTTTNRYVQDYSRPQVLSVYPADQATGILSDADIDITFTEPMDLASFVPPRFQGDTQWTVNVRYSQNPINGTLVNQNLFFNVRVKPETAANVLELRPLQGFGAGPYEVEVVITNAVTDLSGNNINRQFQFTFKTAFNPNADIAGLVQETFANNNQRDTQFGNPAFPLYDKPSGDDVLAYWNTATPGQPGFLVGALSAVNFIAWDFPAQTNYTNVNLWGSAPLRFQNLVTAKDMGGRPRTITAFAWYCSLPTATPPTVPYYHGVAFPNTQVKMGHANDSVGSVGFPTGTNVAGPDDGFFGDVPTIVVPSVVYNQAGQLSGNWVAGPKFAKNFNFDGTHQVILDIKHSGNGVWEDRWLCDRLFALPACTFLNSGATNPGAGTQTWYFETQFTYLTPGAEAQSLFYDSGREDNRFLPQQIIPTTQPQGTAVTFQWQGAKADLANPLKPDLSTLTAWLPDIRSLANFRYFRFRATLLNNLTTRTIPTVDTIYIPFTHK